MKPCREVAPGVWLGFTWCRPSAGATAHERRWARERDTADRAVAAVLEASGYPRNACVSSRTHTCGVAAAVAAPSASRVGVDLVAVHRVGRRHAEAILSRAEWEALAPYAKVRPALAWALKEAAAKAVGDPLRCFPHGLGIAAGDGGPTVLVECGPMRFEAGWGLLDRLLYAWVRGES